MGSWLCRVSGRGLCAKLCDPQLQIRVQPEYGSRQDEYRRHRKGPVKNRNKQTKVQFQTPRVDAAFATQRSIEAAATIDIVNFSCGNPAEIRECLLSELGQNFGRVRIARRCQTPKLIQIFLLSCEFNQLILSVAAAAVGKLSQFLEVFPLRGQLDELADGVVVTAGSPLPECRKIRF